LLGGLIQKIKREIVLRKGKPGIKKKKKGYKKDLRRESQPKAKKTLRGEPRGLILIGDSGT